MQDTIFNKVMNNVADLVEAYGDSDPGSNVPEQIIDGVREGLRGREFTTEREAWSVVADVVSSLDNEPFGVDAYNGNLSEAEMSEGELVRKLNKEADKVLFALATAAEILWVIAK